MEILARNNFAFANSAQIKRNDSVANTKNDLYEKSFIPTKTDDAKSNFVSEKLNDNTEQVQSIRFQSSTPVAKILGSIKLYNETDLVKKTEPEFQKTEIEKDSEAITNEPESSGKGFYIFIPSAQTQNNKLLPKSRIDLIREKIVAAYYSTSRKENGRLVDLTY